MQIHNFYSDLVPSVRSPLDSIVLSPHTIKHDAFNFTSLDADSCDYQTLLPSISNCKYHDQDSCRQNYSVPMRIWKMICVVVRKSRHWILSISKYHVQREGL